MPVQSGGVGFMYQVQGTFCLPKYLLSRGMETRILVLVGIPETHVIIVRLVEVDKRGCACRQIVDIIQPGYQRWYIHLSRFSLSD